MGIKVNVGLAKKIGQPDYGSLGATCNVEFELDGGFDIGSSEHFHDVVRRAYGACRQAVEAEISANRLGPPTNGSAGGPHAEPGNRLENHINGNNGNVRNATSSQVRAIFAIANRNRVDLPGLLGARFGVARPDDLSIGDASSLIDELKNPAGGNSGSVSR